MAPQLRGRWTKLEAEYPPGVSDSFGLWKCQTWWLEHKVGRPDRAALEPGQIDFGFDCRRHAVPWWVVFGWRGKVFFFDHPGLDGGPKAPPFWVSKTVTPYRRNTPTTRITKATSPAAPAVQSIVRKPRKAHE